MSYPVNPDYRSAIIPYFSNPDVKHPDTGSPLGTTNCNNAKALNENDELIKDYRVPKNELTVSDLSLPANEIADFNAISSIHVSNLVTEAGSHTGFKAGSSVVIEKNTIINGKLKTSIVQVAGCASGKILSTTPKQLSLPSCPAIPICVELNCADSYTAQLMNMTNPSRPNWFEVSYASGTITDGKICIPMDQNVKAGNKYALFVEAKNLFIEQVLTFGITIDQGSCPSLTCPTGNCPLMEGAGRQATRVKPEGQQIAISDEVFHSTIHPNPVCNSAVIEYYLPGAAFVSITVFNGMGKQVKFNGHQLLQKGQHQTNFDTSHLTPGFYTYTIHAGGKYETGRFVIVK
jgi:hypothetical protein